MKIESLECAWRRSSRSAQGANCVELAGPRSGRYMIRDSKNPGGPVLAVSANAWRALRSQIKRGDHDLA